jgi:tetratricopeptide (TPR) repeat protein
VLRQTSDSSWQTAYQLVLIYLDRFDDERAEQALKRSMAREVNAWNLQAMGVLQWSRGNRDEAVDCLAQALRRCPSDPALAKDIFKCLRSLQAYRELVELYGCLGADAASRPMVRLLYAFGLAYTGELEAAEAILMENGGIQVPDIQEGEQSCSQLYIHIQQKKAEREGKSLDPNEIQIPQSLDLRMHFS